MRRFTTIFLIALSAIHYQAAAQITNLGSVQFDNNFNIGVLPQINNAVSYTIIVSNNFIDGAALTNIVFSLNNLDGNLELVAGSNITLEVDSTNSQIIITGEAGGGGGGGLPAFEIDLQGRLMPRTLTNWVDEFWALDDNGDLYPRAP